MKIFKKYTKNNDIEACDFIFIKAETGDVANLLCFKMLLSNS